MNAPAALLPEATLILGGIAALVAGLLCMLVPLGIHFGFRAPRIRLRATPADHGLPYQSLRIPTARQRSLAAWLIPAQLARPGGATAERQMPMAERRAQATILILHGWGSNAEQMLPLAYPLAKAGFNLLLLNARNHGDSDSDTFSSLPRFAEDLEHAIDWLRQQQPARAAKIAVIGHSVGAGAALFAATRHAAIDAAISLSAFAHPAEVTARVMAHLPVPRLVVTLVVRYTEWLIGHRFDAIAPINSIRSVRCPVLLAHGTADQLVPYADAEQIYQQRVDDQIQLTAINSAGHDPTPQLETHCEQLLDFLASHIDREP
ncbi:alpha/beta hydrolase [Halochromatium roseum]|uniref:alpha/beta hydrolase n=1 Tax=Halochromatium roseum TaxID=391920 RepID=UPI00191498AC|nr:alpha/beta fold hydrolase [Halochromatium roseum]MBK5939962.1 hypothetical protein [Halochromatium roseum]